MWPPCYSKVGKFTLPLTLGVNTWTPALRIYFDPEARMRNVLGLIAASARRSLPRNAKSSLAHIFCRGFAGLALMQQKAKIVVVASAVLSGFAFTPANAAEREQVR